QAARPLPFSSAAYFSSPVSECALLVTLDAPCPVEQRALMDTKRNGDKTIVEAQAGIYLSRELPSVKVDTSRWCRDIQEVVTVRTDIGGQRVVPISAYTRPGSKTAEDTEKREKIGIAGETEFKTEQQPGDFSGAHTGYAAASAHLASSIQWLRSGFKGLDTNIPVSVWAPPCLVTVDG
ncbi:hypothetical protein HPB47_006611, partial [Ixodes persulcatus]